MPRPTNKALRELTRKYDAAYAAYQSNARAIGKAKQNGASASPALLLKEERALAQLRRARARLLMEMALVAKTP
jgi:hypothetical protein